MLDDDLLGQVDEMRKGRSRGYFIEKVLKAEFARPKGALTVEVGPGVLNSLTHMAIEEKRTVDAQAAWIIEQFCDQEEIKK